MCFRLKLVVLFMFFAVVAQAQMHEFGFMIGGSSYYGDLNTQIQTKMSVPATSFSYRFNFFNKYISAKTSLTFATLKFEDSYSSNTHQLNRNLGFETSITEFAEIIEFHFLQYSKSNKEQVFGPYVFLGFGLFKFMPKRNYEGTDINLKELGTEGQVTVRQDVVQYGLTQFALPFGGGVKYGFNKHFAAVFEIGLRKTSTDYLDDVSQFYPDEDVILRYNKDNPELSILMSDTSIDDIDKEGKQRGNNSKNDNYLVVGISFTYTIHTAKCPLVY